MPVWVCVPTTVCVIPQLLLSYRLFQLCSYQSSKNKSRVWDRNEGGMIFNKDDRDSKYQQTFWNHLKQTWILGVLGKKKHQLERTVVIDAEAMKVHSLWNVLWVQIVFPFQIFRRPHISLYFDQGCTLLNFTASLVRIWIFSQKLKCLLLQKYLKRYITHTR